jgi:hypothetical protein
MSAESRAEKILQATYGFVPTPTEGENRSYEQIIDSSRFQEQQLKRDILRLAKSAELTQDDEMAQIVLAKWNELYPDNSYSSLKLLIGVEDE